MRGARLAVAALLLPGGMALAAPAALVENTGQWPEGVRFASPDGAVVVWEGGLRTPDGAVARFTPGTTLHPEGELGHPTHFLVGRDPARWSRGARSFARVVIVPPGPPAPDEAPWVVDSATLLGGAADDVPVDAELTPDGDTVVLCQTASADFPTTPGAWDAELASFDLAVSKVAADGTGLVWSTFLGGSGTELATALDVDDLGRVTVLGTTMSGDFPVSPWAFQDLLNHGNNTFQPDLVVARLAPEGDSLDFATLLGGGGHETAGDVVATSEGALVVGRTDSSDFPSAHGPPYAAHHGDALLAELDADGGALVDTMFWGGDGTEVANALAVDPGDGTVVVVGDTTSMDFPVSPGALMPDRPAFNSGFALRYRPGTHDHAFITYLAGSYNDSIRDVAVDASGDLVVTGRTRNPFDGSLHFAETGGGLDDELSGEWDAWVARLSADGSAIEAATVIGGDGTESAAGLALLADGAIAVAGTTDSADLGHTTGALTGAQDAFLWVLEPDLSALRYGTWFGGSAAEEAVGLEVSGDTLVLVGSTQSADFPTTAGAWQAAPSAGMDVFVVRVDGPAAAGDTGWDTGPGVGGGGECACAAGTATWSSVWLLLAVWLVRRRRLP